MFCLRTSHTSRKSSQLSHYCSRYTLSPHRSLTTRPIASQHNLAVPAMAARLRSLAKTIGANPKKSVAFVGAVGAVGKYVWGREKRKELLREYAALAAEWGREGISAEARPRRVSVLMNRWASQGGAKAAFEESSLPLLSLAGLEVTLVEAADADEMRRLASVLSSEDADAVYVVGGDGSLSKVLEGMVGNPKGSLPVGVFPGGSRNFSLRGMWRARLEEAGSEQTTTEELLNFVRHEPVSDVRWACESAMALIKDSRASVWPVEVETADGQKRVGLGSVHLGPMRDLEERRFSYWLFGPLRHRFALLWSALTHRSYLTHAKLNFLLHCDGCSSCLANESKALPAPSQRRWWSAFVPQPKPRQLHSRTSITHYCNHLSAMAIYQLEGEKEREERRKRVNADCGVEREISGDWWELRVGSASACSVCGGGSLGRCRRRMRSSRSARAAAAAMPAARRRSASCNWCSDKGCGPFISLLCLPRPALHCAGAL